MEQPKAQPPAFVKQKSFEFILAYFLTVAPNVFFELLAFLGSLRVQKLSKLGVYHEVVAAESDAVREGGSGSDNGRRRCGCLRGVSRGR
jgi:hypothetical protein